jgi:O-antigen/teichoic acid export membrane protein
MSQRLKQDLFNALSYCLVAGVLFYVWNHVKFHWYLVALAVVSMTVKAIWWRRQVGPFNSSTWRKLLWPSPP